MSNLFEYRSVLKNKNISIYQILGITSEIILNKNFFKKNLEVVSFIKLIFNIEFKDYITKSRTMIMAKVLKKIYLSDEKELQEYRKSLINYIESNFYNEESKKNTNNTLSKWIREK